MHLRPEQRETLAALADVLIPAGDGCPSASEAGVATDGIDQVLGFRPDLAAHLPQLLERAQGRRAEAAVAELRQQDPDLFGALAEIVSGAYFLHPLVREQLRYQGQNPRPIQPESDYQDLLQAVIDRGPIYRVPPDKS